MLSLLFAIAYWCVVAGVAFGALCFLAFIALLIDEYLEGVPDYRQRPLSRPPRAVRPNVRPFDRDDPLEQLFLLPDAPNPRWRVR